ncbi:hypothetical protein [uncultured Mediterranean phage]|nr:hypothetical protein [uncultured Mediterranean phage]
MRPPNSKALILSDVAIMDHLTGKWSLIGLFDNFYGDKFPLTVAPFAVYCRISDIPAHPYKVLLRITNPEGRMINEIPMTGVGRAESGRDYFECVGVFKTFIAERPGDYAVESVVEGNVVAVTTTKILKPNDVESFTEE